MKAIKYFADVADWKAGMAIGKSEIFLSIYKLKLKCKVLTEEGFFWKPLKITFNSMTITLSAKQ